MADGYAGLDPHDPPGLGAHAHAGFGIPVTKAAKFPFRTATYAVPVLRGTSMRPTVRDRGRDARRRRREPGPGAWLAGTDGPARCAAPIAWHGQARPQLPGPAANPADLRRRAECGRSGHSPQTCQCINMQPG